MPSVAVNPPKTPVTKGSSGMATATLPNMCKMPPPPPPFCPTPLPNIGMSGKNPQKYSTTVKIEGNPVAIQGSTFDSTGDIASKGTGGGVVSNNAEGPTAFIAPGSLDVKIEGKDVQFLGDQMLNNCGPAGSPANSATMGGVIQGVAAGDFADRVGDPELADELCQAACEAMHKPDPKFRHRQDQMACQFSKTDASGLATPPSYQALSNRIVPEVSQVIPSSAGGGMRTLLSRTGRTMPGSLARAARSMVAAMRTSEAGALVTRWDFAIPSAGGSLNNNNLRKVIEVKFPGDPGHTKNQIEARKLMTPAERAKIVEMDPATDCACTEDGQHLPPPTG